MGDLPRNLQDLASCQQYCTLLEVAEAIISHRDLPSLFHDLGDRLRQVVRFDYLLLVLHDDTSNTMRLHVLETAHASSRLPSIPTPVDEAPSGLVWQTQQPLVVRNVEEDSRWPALTENVFRPNGMISFCYVPLTTARARLGTLGFASREPAVFDGADLYF